MNVVGDAVNLYTIAFGILHGSSRGRHAVGKPVGEHNEDFPCLPHGAQTRQHTPHGGGERSQSIGWNIGKNTADSPTMTENVRHGRGRFIIEVGVLHGKNG